QTIRQPLHINTIPADKSPAWAIASTNLSQAPCIPWLTPLSLLPLLLRFKHLARHQTTFLLWGAVSGLLSTIKAIRQLMVLRRHQRRHTRSVVVSGRLQHFADRR